MVLGTDDIVFLTGCFIFRVSFARHLEGSCLEMLDISFATVVSRDVWRKLPNQQPIGPVKFLAQLSRKPGNSLVNTLGKIDPFLHDFSIFYPKYIQPKELFNSSSFIQKCVWLLFFYNSSSKNFQNQDVGFLFCSCFGWHRFRGHPEL